MTLICLVVLVSMVCNMYTYLRMTMHRHASQSYHMSGMQEGNSNGKIIILPLQHHRSCRHCWSTPRCGGYHLRWALSGTAVLFTKNFGRKWQFRPQPSTLCCHRFSSPGLVHHHPSHCHDRRDARDLLPPTPTVVVMWSSGTGRIPLPRSIIVGVFEVLSSVIFIIPQEIYQYFEQYLCRLIELEKKQKQRFQVEE